MQPFLLKDKNCIKSHLVLFASVHISKARDMGLIKFVILTVATVLVAQVEGRGRLVVPLNRGSLWRVDLSEHNVTAPVDENDDGNNCGGLIVSIFHHPSIFVLILLTFFMCTF